MDDRWFRTPPKDTDQFALVCSSFADNFHYIVSMSVENQMPYLIERCMVRRRPTIRDDESSAWVFVSEWTFSSDAEPKEYFATIKGKGHEWVRRKI